MNNSLKIMNVTLVIDFDSTFVSVEALEELAKISLRNKPNQEEILNQIEQITSQGMSGKINFEDSISRRLKMFNPSYADLDELDKLLKSKVSDSIIKNKSFFKKNSGNIKIISGGFHEWIDSVVIDYGISKSDVFANRFIIDHNTLTLDPNSKLTKSGAKSKIVEEQNWKNRIIVMGDGFTDYEIRRDGCAKEFIAFSENVKRIDVIQKADFVAQNFFEVIEFLEKSPN